MVGLLASYMKCGQPSNYIKMREDYNAVLAAVSRATGIPEGWIFSKRRGQDYYDARWIVVQLLADKGYYPGTIANLTGMTRRNVCKILNAIRGRKGCTWELFSKRLERVRNAIGTADMA